MYCNSLVDCANFWTLDTFPNCVILLRESLLKQLVVQIDSAEVAAFVLIQAEGQIHSAVQACML